MSEEKKRINVYIPGELYVKVAQSDYTLTDAVIKGLEKLLEPAKEENTIEPIGNIEPKILEAKEAIILTQNNRIESLEEQLKVKDSQMNDRVKSLEDQLKTKDSQISELIKSQAVHIQTLINQNHKQLPEPNKKPWWKFW